MKSSVMNEMDLEEWEVLPEEGFLEINDDGEGNKIYSRNYQEYHPTKGGSTVFQMNYFICPPPPPSELAGKTGRPTPSWVPDQQLLPVPVPIDDDRRRTNNQVVKKKETEKIVRSFSRCLGADGDQEDPAVSQVFFRKMNETEFADMKVDSPRSTSATNNWGLMPPTTQIEGTGAFQFEENGDPNCKEAQVDDSETSVIKKHDRDNMEMDDDKEGGLMNIWKWSLNGIGAICSFGVAAAATVCIITFSSHHQKNNQKLHFQIYTSDKRMKKVVQHASKLNEAISASVRGRGGGVPITRAHITFGGYYDAAAAASL